MALIGLSGHDIIAVFNQAPVNPAIKIAKRATENADF
jgi:hypothetical protein